jgi:hypothetical protein
MKNDKYTTTKNKHLKLLICIYTNGARNEFAIGLKEDANFRAMTKVDEFYTRFVDAFDEIFTEVDLTGWNEAGERKEKN